jgi:hypothetical protein
MKLYDLQRGDRFKLIEDARIPPAAPEGRMGVVYDFSHVDGMYAPVTDPEGNRHYFAAWTEVEAVE